MGALGIMGVFCLSFFKFHCFMWLSLALPSRFCVRSLMHSARGALFKVLHLCLPLRSINVQKQSVVHLPREHHVLPYSSSQLDLSRPAAFLREDTDSKLSINDINSEAPISPERLVFNRIHDERVGRPCFRCIVKLCYQGDRQTSRAQIRVGGTGRRIHHLHI